MLGQPAQPKNDTPNSLVRTLALHFSLFHHNHNHHNLDGCPTMDNAPAIKPLGSLDKETLQKLIHQPDQQPGLHQPGKTKMLL
jgi:hypothetical protein